MKIKRGTLLVTTQGEYSSYSFAGPFRVLKAFDQHDVTEQYREDWAKSEHEDWEEPDRSGFIGWLVARGFIEDTECLTWHIGDYGLDPEFQ